MALSLSPAWALSGNEHAALWNDVFGIVDAQSQQAIQPLWKAAQEVIDEYVDDYRELSNRFPWFKLQIVRGEHRFLFHWGFNADPKRHQPLQRKIKERLDKYAEEQMKSASSAEINRWKDKQEKEFFRYLTRTIQSRRNKKLINAVVETTSIPTARGYANAVATILYDVHLLGDYQTTATSALPKIGAIENDLVEDGFRRLLAGGDKTERLDKIRAELDAAVRVGRGRIDSKRAALLLDTAKRLLPPILNERFRNTLAEHGITVTEPPE